MTHEYDTSGYIKIDSEVGRRMTRENIKEREQMLTDIRELRVDLTKWFNVFGYASSDLHKEHTGELLNRTKHYNEETNHADK